MYILLFDLVSGRLKLPLSSGAGSKKLLSHCKQRQLECLS